MIGGEGAEEPVSVPSTAGDHRCAAVEVGSTSPHAFPTAQGKTWSQQPSYPAPFFVSPLKPCLHSFLIVTETAFEKKNI